MRRALGTVACAVWSLMLMAGTTATADPSGGGAERWAAQYRFGASGYSSAVTVGPDGSVVFVTGKMSFGSSPRFATLAFDASSGDQRWVSTFPSDASGEWGFGRALVVSPDGSTLFVTGSSKCVADCDASSFEGFSTVAYEASTGDRLWVSRLRAPGGAPTSIGVTPDGSTVLVAGNDGLDGSYVFAYDAASGRRLWRNDRQKGEAYYGSGMSVSPDGATVYVTDTAPPDYENCFSAGGYRTTAFDTSTGALKWSSTYKVTDHSSICGTPTDLSLSADGSKVYVTGYGALAAMDHSGRYRSSTVAYNAQTGTQSWATIDDDIRVLAGDTVISLGVSPDDSAVFVFGDGCTEYPACHFTTVAYDASTGGRKWISRYDGGGRGYAQDLAVSPDGSSLFITGQETMPCFAGCTGARLDAPLVAYDTANGDVRWATTYTDNLGAALAVSPDGASVYVAGTFTASASTSNATTAQRATSCTDRCGYSVTRYNTGPGPGTFQDSDPFVSYDSWRAFFDKSAVGGAYRGSNVAGYTATFRTPKTTSVSWLTLEGPNQGKAKIIIDGRSRGIVDLYSSAPSARAVTFDGLAREAHTVKVKVLGRSAPASQGMWVAVDGFRFRAGDGIAQESSAKVRYNSWAGRSKSAASGGSLRKSGSPEARVSLDFRGRTIKWITATGPTYGRAKVVIDGEAQNVDLYRPTRHSRVAISYTGLPKGPHHLVVRPLGRKNPDSSSTEVVVDAFIVRR